MNTMGRSSAACMGAAAIATAGTLGSAPRGSTEGSTQSPGLSFLAPGEAQQVVSRLEISRNLVAHTRAGPVAAGGLSWSTTAQRVGTLLFAATAVPQLRTRRSKLARRAAPKEEPELKSDKDVDYTPLRELLAAKDFKAADAETRRLLIVLAGPEALKRGWVYFAEVKKIPDVDFVTIDRLWQFFSGGKFGFTPQRKVWRKVRGAFDKFAEEVSWFTDKWQNRNWPDEFVYDEKEAPAGHLPLTNCIRGAQVLDELLNHPSFSTKQVATGTKKKGGLGLLAFGRHEQTSTPMTLAGASVPSSSGRRYVACRAAAETSAPPVVAGSALSSLEMHEVVNEFGFVFPEVPDDSEASAFLIYDSQKRPQYLGFSKDLRNTLRTLLVRRPELCYSYKCAHFAKAGKEQLMELRQQWVQELGGLPAGNAEARQKNIWESPADGGGMSKRAYRTAADQKAKQVERQLKDRGLKERIEFNEELLEEGKVDALPSVVDKGELSQQQQALSSQTTSVTKTVGGKDYTFDVFYSSEFKTNGGWWFDVEVSAEKQKSSHRVIVGMDFMGKVGAESPREVVEAAFAMVLAKKVPRHTEGIITSENFPINYFTAANIATWFPDFLELFSGEKTGVFDENTNQWNFKQVHDYSQDNKRTIPAGPNGGFFDPAALQ